MGSKQTELIRETNARIQTPYSFSPFRDMKTLFAKAKAENIEVLGISDLNTAEGYVKFHDTALEYGIFPLFNIRLSGISMLHQGSGIRLNDHFQAGKISLSGLGMDVPFSPGLYWAGRLQTIREEEEKRMKEMLNRANRYFRGVGTDISLDYSEIRSTLSKRQVTDRHIARAIRINLYKNSEDEKGRLSLFRKLYAGKNPLARMGDEAAVENEIRQRLLRPGGAAFVEENPSHAFSPEEMLTMIRDGGGIPAYPMGMDDENGQFTEFESQRDKFCENLHKWGIRYVELIPSRSNLAGLLDTIDYLNRKNFLLLAGTEQSSPRIHSLKVHSRESEALPASVKKMFWEGSCLIAAHQYLRAKGKKGFYEPDGLVRQRQRADMIQLGKTVIHHFYSAGMPVPITP